LSTNDLIAGCGAYRHFERQSQFSARAAPCEKSKRGWLVADQTELTKLPATKLPRSLAAERMRRHRERRRDGLRCLTIELRETEIDALARNGLLKADARNDPYAIEMALYQFLERTLG
jgi:hypothetical protein